MTEDQMALLRRYGRIPSALGGACAAAIAEIEALRSDKDQLLELSRGLHEHPDGYEGPCLCELCLSYCD